MEMTRATTSAPTAACVLPAPMTRPKMYPTAPVNTSAPAMSSTVLRSFRAICSRKGLELDLDGTAGGLLDLEELPRREMTHPGDDAGGKRLDLRVQRGHLVVVELPGVGDLRLGPGQLLLQRQEVLVRFQVRIVLGHRQELAKRPADLVFGVGLAAHAGGLLGLAARPGDLLEDLALVAGVA